MIGDKHCLLIVDDEPNIVRALKDFLETKPFVVLCAYDGAEALTLFYEHAREIDLLLLDVMMPKCDGFSLLKQLRAQQVTTPAIMLSARSEVHDELTGFSVGADDYIAKPFSPSLLLARIESVLRRCGRTPGSIVRAGALLLDIEQRTCTLDGQPLILTKREFDLLAFLMQSPARPFSRTHLLDAVWGYDFDGDIRTVDTHIKQLRLKLLHCADYLRTVHRVGYCFEVSL